MSRAWKDFESEVARFVHGERVIRVSYSESSVDIIHPSYSIECKYGKQVPAHLVPRVPVELTVGTRKFAVVPTEFLKVAGDLIVGLPDLIVKLIKKKIKHSAFLLSAMGQASGYNPTLIPMVCVKKPRQHGFICIWEMR